MWGIPLLTLFIVSIVLIFFRDSIIEKLPIPGAEMFASYDRGYGDTILSYTDRSYEDAEWSELETFPTIMEASLGEEPRLANIIGWSDNSYWILTNEAVFHNHGGTLQRTHKLPSDNNFMAGRAYGEHDLILCYSDYSDTKIIRLSKGGESSHLKGDDDSLSYNERLGFTVVSPDLALLNGPRQAYVTCTDTSFTAITPGKANKTFIYNKDVKESSYTVNNILFTACPKENEAYGLCFPSSSRDKPLFVIRFAGE